MLIRRIIIASVAAVLGGCSHSIGVLQVDTNKFSASAVVSPRRGGATRAQGIVLEQANEYCSELGKKIANSEITTGTVNDYGDGSAVVTFECR